MIQFLAVFLCGFICLNLNSTEVFAAESEGLYAAIEAVNRGNPTPGQKAVVFAANDKINYMRMTGVITSRQYQASQEVFDTISQQYAKNASSRNKADFNMQVASSPNYKEGTDSDYILKMKGKQPVDDIRRIKSEYNKQVNDFLREHKGELAKAGLSTKPRYNWHNKLDVDFMVDPRSVSKSQFEQVARENNDAYKRPGAAKYEFVTRGGEGKLTPQDFRDFAEEMQEFTDKKQRKLDKYRKNPELLHDPMKQAEFYRLMAQEQKYIDRGQKLVDAIRQKYGLKGPKYGGGGQPYYEMVVDPVKGTATLKRRLPGKLAAHGAGRSPENFKITAGASSVSTNSIRNSQLELAEVISRVNRNGKWPNAARDIAALTKDLPPADKGRLIERIGRRRGKVFANELVNEMRTLVPQRQKVSFANKVASKLDGLPKVLPGYTEDLSKVSAARAGLNRAARRAVGLYGKYASAEMYMGAAKLGTSYWDLIARATDPNTSDKEADALFEQASDVSWQMARMGLEGAAMHAMFAKTPTLAALHTSFTLGKAGGDYFFNNTETGREIMASSLRATRSTIDRLDRGLDLLSEFTGGTSQRMLDRERADAIESKFREQHAQGNITLQEGVHIDDVVALLRQGQYNKARDLYNRKGQKPRKRPARTTGSRNGGTKTRVSRGGRHPSFTPNTEWEYYTHPVGSESFVYKQPPRMPRRKVGIENIFEDYRRPQLQKVRPSNKVPLTIKEPTEKKEPEEKAKPKDKKKPNPESIMVKIRRDKDPELAKVRRRTSSRRRETSDIRASNDRRLSNRSNSARRGATEEPLSGTVARSKKPTGFAGGCKILKRPAKRRSGFSNDYVLAKLQQAKLRDKQRVSLIKAEKRRKSRERMARIMNALLEAAATPTPMDSDDYYQSNPIPIETSENSDTGLFDNSLERIPTLSMPGYCEGHHH